MTAVRRHTQRDVRLYCARGEQMPQAKLTDATASEILRTYKPYSRTHGANRPTDLRAFRVPLVRTLSHGTTSGA